MTDRSNPNPNPIEPDRTRSRSNPIEPDRSIDREPPRATPHDTPPRMFSACFGSARDLRALDDDDDGHGGGGRVASASSSASKASTRRRGDDDDGRRRRRRGARERERSRFAPARGAGRADGTSASESGTPSEDEEDDDDEGSMRGCDFGLSRTTWRANVGNGVDANAALRVWLKRREMWRNVGNRSGRRRGGGAHDDHGATTTTTTTTNNLSLTSLSSSSRRYGVSKRQGIPNGASYDSFLANRPASKAFKQPIALPDMVDFLNQCWAEGDGL